MSDVFDGALDLTGADADDVGFPAIPSGKYEAHVAKAEWRTTSNVDGSKALPHETPYLSLGIQVNEDVEPRDGQKVANVYAGWQNLYVPPPEHDATKAQRMKNMMANFLNAIGEDWQKKGYKIPDVENLIGRDLTVIVRKKFDKNQDKYVNEIEGFKPAGSAASSDDPVGLLR
jgi:hypothetical protein